MAQRRKLIVGIHMDWGAAESTAKIKQITDKQGSLVLNGALGWEGLYEGESAGVCPSLKTLPKALLIHPHAWGSHSSRAVTGPHVSVTWGCSLTRGL